MDLIAQFTSQNCPNFNGKDGDWSAHNAGVTPHFYTDKVKRKDKDGIETEIELEYVTVVVAGDTLTEASQPVDDQLRERFADAYAAWKAGKDIIIGTPVTDWPLITSRQAVFLEANNIFSVENLAELSDYNIGGIPDGRELRDKAVRWLRKKGTADLAAENARLLARVAALEKAQPKRKRPEMPKEQRDKVAARQRARHAEAKRGLEALKAMEAAGAK